MIRKGSSRLSPRALKQIHGRLVVKGITAHLQPLRDLLLSCIVSFPGDMGYARKLFDGIPSPDLFMHNAMLRGYAHSATPSVAFSVYRHMEGFGVASNLLDESRERDAVAWSAVIAGYAARGDLGAARQMFDECQHKDLVCWNVMIGAYAKHGEMEKARELFDRAPEKDVVSWNTVITGYAAWGMLKQALEVFDEMSSVGQAIDEATIVSLLLCCTNSRSLDTGRMIHSLLLEDKPWISIITGNALVSMYTKCGDIQTAMKVFSRMSERDVWTWNSIIVGLAFHGQAEKSVKFFEKMLEDGVRPNDISFLCVFSACSHAGLVEVGWKYFSLMKDDYRIEPDARHYSCMVDMLGRAGLLGKAFELVSNMRCEPNVVLWRTLLGACRTHGNVALGEVAKERILKMGEAASGDYVLLSGIYMSSGEWLGAEMMRRSMDKRGMRKAAAYAQVGEKRRLIPGAQLPQEGWQMTAA